MFIARDLTRALLAPLLTFTLVACAGGGDSPTAPAMSINIQNATLGIGENVQLSAVNARGLVTWSSSNTAVATVVSTGFVSAVGAGTTTITASTESQSASTVVTVLQPPAIGLDASSVTFSARAGSANPGARTIAIVNAGQGTLAGVQVGGVTYGAGQPGQWLSTTLSANTAPATLTLGASVTGLIPGTYSATVQLIATGAAPREIAVSFTVTAPPTLELSATSAQFTGVAGGANPAAVAINVTSGSPAAATGLSVSIAYGQSASGWLSAGLSNTSTPASLSLSVNTASLAPGTYTASVTLASPDAANAPRTVLVTLVISAPPAIGVSVSSLAFAATVGGANAAAQTAQISNAGGGALGGITVAVEYGTASGWLNASLNQTTAPATLTIQPVTGSLAAGTYTATVRVSAPLASNTPQTIAVTLTVTAGAIITVSPTSLAITGSLTTPPAARQVMVTNTGGSTLTGLSLSVQYQTGSGWLTASLNTTTAPATISVQASPAGLSAGTYTATLRVLSAAAGNSPVSVPITYTIAAQPEIVLSATSRTFSMVVGEANPVAQNVIVNNGGGGTLSGLSTSITYGSGSGWLSAALASSTAPTSIAITASRGALTAGTYTARITVSSSIASNTPQEIDVTFTIATAPSIGLSSTAGGFTRVSGGGTSGAFNVTISNTGGGTLSGLSASIIYLTGPSPNTGWLSGTISSSTAPATISLVANAGTPSVPRAPGTYTAIVRVISSVASNSPRDIAIEFDVPVSFTNNIYSQLYPTYCEACHFSGGSQPNLSSVSAFRANMIGVLTTNRSASFPLATQYPRRIVAGSATMSYLTYQLQKSTGAFHMPTGAQQVPESLRALISTWINQGANNN